MNFRLVLIVGLLLSSASGCSQATDLDSSPENVLDILIEKAGAGDSEAAYHVGMFYNNGVGTAQNPEIALEWFMKSTNGGDPLGAYKLGCYYAGQFGDVIEYNEDLATENKLMAAEAGYALAQHDVALYYLQENKHDLAIEYLEKAAKQGFQGAYTTLVTLYYRSEVVDTDIVKARSFTKLAIANMSADVANNFNPIVQSMEDQLTTTQIAQSDNFVENWTIAPSPLTKLAELGLERSYALAGATLATAE